MSDEPDMIINQTIVEYYVSYFTPFKEFTDAERDHLRKRLLLEDKKNGTYEKHSKELEEKYKHTEYDYETDMPTSETFEDPSAFGGQDTEYGSLHTADGSRVADDGPLHTAEEKEAYARIQRKVNKLHDLINDKAATDGEKVAANRQLMRLMPQLIEGNYLVTIEQRIDRMEKQRRKMHVDNLSFNSYYEFAIERIPQIMREKSITFDIDNFAAILEQFYKGGELEHTLNNDVDASLFDEKFIVFEIDKIKDDPVLFPIVVLIISAVPHRRAHHHGRVPSEDAHQERPQGPHHRGSVESHLLTYHGRVHQVSLQDREKVPRHRRSGDPRAQRCHRQSHRQGSHHQQL